MFFRNLFRCGRRSPNATDGTPVTAVTLKPDEVAFRPVRTAASKALGLPRKNVRTIALEQNTELKYHSTFHKRCIINNPSAFYLHPTFLPSLENLNVLSVRLTLKFAQRVEANRFPCILVGSNHVSLFGAEGSMLEMLKTVKEVRHAGEEYVLEIPLRIYPRGMHQMPIDIRTAMGEPVPFRRKFESPLLQGPLVILVGYSALVKEHQVPFQVTQCCVDYSILCHSGSISGPDWLSSSSFDDLDEFETISYSSSVGDMTQVASLSGSRQATGFEVWTIAACVSTPSLWQPVLADQVLTMQTTGRSFAEYDRARIVWDPALKVRQVNVLVTTTAPCRRSWDPMPLLGDESQYYSFLGQVSNHEL